MELGGRQSGLEKKGSLTARSGEKKRGQGGASPLPPPLEGTAMTKKQKKMLSRILISAVLFLLLYTVPAQGVVRLPVSYTHLDVYKRQT